MFHRPHHSAFIKCSCYHTILTRVFHCFNSFLHWQVLQLNIFYVNELIINLYFDVNCEWCEMKLQLP